MSLDSLIAIYFLVAGSLQGPSRVEAAKSGEISADSVRCNLQSGEWKVTHLIKSLAMRFVRDESGATAIEYGLIAAGISVAIIAVVNTLGGQLGNTFTNVSNSLANAGK